MFVNARNNNHDCVFVAYRKIIQCDYQTAIEALNDVTYLEDMNDKNKLTETLKNEAFLCYVEKLKSTKGLSLNIDDLAKIFFKSSTDVKNTIEKKIRQNEISGKIQDNLIEIFDNDENEMRNEFQWDLLQSGIRLLEYKKLENENID